MSQKASRRQLRTTAMQALFQRDAQGADSDSALDDFLMADGLTGSDLQSARTFVTTTIEHLEMIDQHLAQAATNWSVARMPPVDRAILRLGLCELLVLQSAPHKVVINEAVELAREYGSKESPRFVNGVLDAIWKQLEALRSPDNRR